MKGIDIISLDKKSDERGELAALPDAAPPWPMGPNTNPRSITAEHESWGIHRINAKPGKVHGNHYHTRKWEWLVVVTGSGLLRVRNIDTGEEQDISLGVSALKAVRIAPGIAHAVKNAGSGEMVFLVYYNEKYDPADPDTVRHPILE